MLNDVISQEVSYSSFKQLANHVGVLMQFDDCLAKRTKRWRGQWVSLALLWSVLVYREKQEANLDMTVKL